MRKTADGNSAASKPAKGPGAKPLPNGADHPNTSHKGATTLPALLRELDAIMDADLPIEEKLARVNEVRLAAAAALKIFGRPQERTGRSKDANLAALEPPLPIYSPHADPRSQIWCATVRPVKQRLWWLNYPASSGVGDNSVPTPHQSTFRKCKAEAPERITSSEPGMALVGITLAGDQRTNLKGCDSRHRKFAHSG
jgi:hypothetical protein